MRKPVPARWGQLLRVSCQSLTENALFSKALVTKTWMGSRWFDPCCLFTPFAGCSPSRVLKNSCQILRATSFCQRGAKRASSRASFWKHAYVTGSGGGVCQRSSCVTCTCYVTSWVEGVGCVQVYVNLHHMHMLRHVLGWKGGVC